MTVTCKTSEIKLQMHCGGGSFKSQFKKADKSGATVALVLGDDEIAQQSVGVKHLREDWPQKTVAQDQLADWLKELLF